MTENEKEVLSFELREEDGTNERCNGDERTSRLEHGNKNVDSGWAWVVLAALPFLTIGLRFYSTRQLVITAGLLSGTSFIIASLANSVKVLIFTYGVMLGISFALLHGPVSYLIGVYFVKRRNLAQAICGSGFGLGGLIFPPIYTYFIEKYGLRGGLLLTGGVQLNIVAFALFLRPLSSNVLQERETKTKKQENKENTTAFKSKPETPVSPEELQNFLTKKQNIEENFNFQEIYGVISGLNAGCLLALTPAIIGDFLGMENFRSAMGILMFGEGITTGLAAPFIGYLRDITGNYVASLFFMSACSLISAIVFIGGLLGKRPWTLRNKQSNDLGKRTSL
ncbi:unnamed protein product [Mytilus edulis]|uniref:Monocarboxylate transporter n=1 Tax=Mytilus edulis TaxID=6550 RepID=A0A8S3RL35_MYTED|nr:unnamed protein product [Mytilus edulis]